MDLPLHSSILAVIESEPSGNCPCTAGMSPRWLALPAEGRTGKLAPVPDPVGLLVRCFDPSCLRELSCGLLKTLSPASCVLVVGTSCKIRD